jgi:hypothetical protein
MIHQFANNIAFASGALISFLDRMRVLGEVKRLARCSVALVLSGAIPRSTLLKQVSSSIKARQNDDGGWHDVEETLWAARLLSAYSPEFAVFVAQALNFISAQKAADGAWGQSGRDMSRIPQTSLVAHFFPEVSDDCALHWLTKQWSADLGMETSLTYKGGFFLLGINAGQLTTEAHTLVEETTLYIAREQNDDGGFGPWKGHPIGSDPWSTGVVLWGLSRWIDRVDRRVIEKALDWLERTQLSSGYWPYHYLDEGTSYALIGAVSALKALQRL